MSTIIVGLMGKMGSGKDTVAERLVARHSFTRMALADEIRKELAEEYGVPFELFTDRSRKEIPCAALGGRSPREVMREHGGWRRDVFGEDYWVNKVAAIINASDLLEARYVISDIRMPNEYDWIASESGILMRVIRPALEAEMVASGAYAHFTETALDDYAADMDLINHEEQMDRLFEAVDAFAAGLSHASNRASPPIAAIA